MDHCILSQQNTVILENNKSDPIPAITSGVPQDSVLGPMLCLLYINNLPTSMSSNIRLFADDAIIYRQITKQADCITLQNDLNRLAIWENTWKMEFNTAKCESLSITRNRNPIQFRCLLHNTALGRVTSTKYVGITFTSDLNWNKHIATIASNANKTLGFIKCNIHTHPNQLRPVRTKSSYGQPWSTLPLLGTHIPQQQYTNWRWCSDAQPDTSQDASVTDMLHHLEWKSLQQRRPIASLVLLYKTTNNLVVVLPPTYLTPWIKPSTRSHNLCYMLYTCNTLTDYHDNTTGNSGK